MATYTHSYRQPYPLRLTIAKKTDSIIEALQPRRCMLVSASLLIAGLSAPILMAAGLLPINLMIGLLALGLTATGGVLSLTLSGEIYWPVLGEAPCSRQPITKFASGMC